MRTLPIGSFSSGTLRTEDVGDALSSLLGSLCLSKIHRQLVREWDRLRSYDAPDEELDGVLDELWDAAEEYAPSYCTVGAAEGDGAEFGVWPSIEALEYATQTGEVLKLNDLAELPRGHTGEVMLVNDHGNVTFGRAVRGRFYAEWDCV